MNILGIDIGGTKTIAGVADQTGRILAQKRIETPGVLGPDVNLTRIKAMAHEVIDRSGASIDLIGIGCGGPLDRKSGTLHKVPNLPGWEGLCLTKIFTDEFSAPAYLDNDATVAAIGEMMFGAGKGIDDFAYFTISTGIGGGIIAGGKVYRGHGDNAGEFGHMKIKPNGPPCPCGDNGCLEALASGTSIARIAREQLEDRPKTIIWNWIKTPDKVTAEMVAKATDHGDQFAARIWNNAMFHLGLGVANVVNVLNPRLVILGGGVTRAGDLLFEPVRETVRQHAMKALADDVEIVPAANGDNVGLMGAVALAIEQAGN